MDDDTNTPSVVPPAMPFGVRAKRFAQRWRKRAPAAWGVVAGFAAASALLALVLPGSLLAPLAGGAAPALAGRLALAFVAALAIAGLMLAVFYVRLPRLGTLTVAVPGAERPLSMRRADAHPDAPPRRPLLAQDEIGEPWQPEHTPGPDPYARTPSPSVAPAPVQAGGVESLIGRLESGLTIKPSPGERTGPRAVADGEAEHPSPAIRQQRELSAALRESLDLLGGPRIARGQA